MSASLIDLRVRPVTVRLPKPWGSDVTSITYLDTVVVDSDGAEGHGVSWTPTIGAASVTAMLEHDIRDRVLGGSVDPRQVWEPLWRALHEAGGGGVTTIAMAGLDLALWDLAARRAGLPLAGLLGVPETPVEAYGSGVNLHYPLEELLAQARSWVGSGFAAVKIKVGSPDLERDVERVREVRAVIGDRRLMIDANQRWTREQAAEAVARLSAFDIAWIEEPLRADDLDGHRWLRERCPIPIACGENLYTHYRFGEFARSGAVSILQPNLVRIGGLTPLASIDAACASEGVDVALHLLPELSAQVVGTLARPTAVEIVDGADLDGLGVLAEPGPVSFADGTLTPRPHLGLGLRFR